MKKMTNNEAIGILAIVVETAKGRCFVTDEAISDAYAMAIKALEAQELSKNSPKLDKENGDLQPTCNQLATDCISRQAVLDEIDGFLAADKYYHPYSQGKTIPVEEMRERLNRLPLAQPEIEERKEESAQNVPKEDLISRKAATDAAESAFVRGVFPTPYIRELPSAPPEPLVKKSRTLVNDLVKDTVSRQAAIATVKNVRKVCDTNDINDYHDLLIEAFNVLPSAQPEPSIPISWIEEQIDWLKSMDNEFSNITAMNISTLVKKWRKENGKDEGSD